MASHPFPKRLSLPVLLLAAAATAPSLFAQGQPAGPPAGPASAENPSPAPAASSPSSDRIIKLEKYTVSDVPLEEQVLPTVRPVGSVLGDDASVLDLPRSVTTVDKAWMQERQVTDATDFGQFSPGVYSPARYGVPATPQIRGDNGQICMNGQQTLYTTESIFPSFNGIEALDIVKGPGSAVFGPQSEAPGGYVNLVTKEPYFDHEHTEIDMTFGAWTSGHSEFAPELTIDTGAPITDDLAWRVSYLSRYGQGYYLNDPNMTQDVFFAVAYHPKKGVRLDGWIQWYGSRFNDVTGVNRPTQQFIWNGTYIGGPVVDYPDVPPYGIGAVDGSYGVLNAATAYTVKLPSYKVLSTPYDVARTGRWQTQLMATLDLTQVSKLVDLTYLESANDREINYWGYDEYMPVQESAQNRLEYHADFATGPVKNSIIAGADFRYTRIVSYQDYALDPYFTYDVNRPSSTFLFPYAQDQETFGGGFSVPGGKGYSAYLPGDSSNQDSHIYDTSVFLQDNVTFLSKFGGVVGARVDHIKADDGNPNLLRDFDPVTGIVSNPPLPVSAGSIYSASGSVNDPSLFASLSYRPTETRSFYISYNHVNAVQGSLNFGGVDVYEITDGANTPIGTPADYHGQLITALKTRSAMYEAGYKESFLGNTLYFDLTIYQQVKTQPQIKGAPSFLVKANGIETELVYQPTKALTLNANATYQNVTDFGSEFYENTWSYLDGYPVGFNVDGQSGTGNGSPNFDSVPQNNYAGYYTPPNNRMRAPGVPQVLANLFVQYQFPGGYGFGIGPQYHGSEYADDEDSLHIPSGYELDGYLFYRRKTWDVQLNIKNLTNQRLLDPVDVTFAGNDAIFVRPPISASLTIRLHF
jgi:outer membrane receptor for monomeric catechols